MKRFFLFFSVILLSASLFAQDAKPKDPPKAPPTETEGMWLPFMVEKLNYADMKALGFKLPADKVYNEKAPSLKDAIVQLGGFCTAEMISPEGLMLTNHHCAYDAIATLSSVEDDYLTDGFWAANKGKELNVPGLTATMLVSSKDVTKEVLDGSNGDPMAIAQKIEEIQEAAVGDNEDYKAEVKEFFHGNEYYLFVYETFRDVRLVGAPPSSIGKYGGDTDNWMWPRHTGDFSLLRVYAGAGNTPADYSEENKPYKPKHFLPISLKGIQENDYAMVMGYPGSTSRYLTSSAIDLALNQTNNDRILLMGQKLRTMKEAMDADDAVRIALASDYASLSNYHKYLIGQTKMLKRYDILGMKKKEERVFDQWVNANASRDEYKGVLKNIDKLHNDYVETDRFMSYLNFGALASEASVYAIQFFRLQRTLEAGGDVSPMTGNMQEELDEHFESYFTKLDKKLFIQSLLTFYKNVDPKMHPPIFKDMLIHKKAKKGLTNEDKVRMWGEYAFNTSIATNKARAQAFLKAPSEKVVANDLIVQYVTDVIGYFRGEIAVGYQTFEGNIEEARKTYIKGLREMHDDKVYYPDANFTMRLTYGIVTPYDPQDAVAYDYITSLDGVMEKEDPSNDEFIVPKKLKDLWQKKDYGEYAENGKMPVCFLSTNDITGGNSGSPVLNANGELIGCAFDGNWEAMASDIHVFSDVTRTISVDIRYVLFIIDKFAGASHLLDEMKIIR